MSQYPALDKLGPQARMFVMEYIKDFKHTCAAERVTGTAGHGKEFMADTLVLDAVAEQVDARNQRTEIDADWVLTQLGQMFNADVADIFDPATNTIRPIHEWPEIWRKMSTGVTVRELKEQGQKIGEVVNVKLLDRLKAIELIGKHTDVRAFTERVEIATDQQLMDQLLSARKRARERNKPADDVPSFL